MSHMTKSSMERRHALSKKAQAIRETADRLNAKCDAMNAFIHGVEAALDGCEYEFSHRGLVYTNKLDNRWCLVHLGSTAGDVNPLLRASRLVRARAVEALPEFLDAMLAELEKLNRAAVDLP